MKQKIKTRDLVYMALFTALITVGAYIQIPVPYVPFTLQTLFTAMAGLLLGPWLGAGSALLYLVLGLIGLPVFSGGAGGIGYAIHPTFGFIIGFVVGTFLTGYLTRKSTELTFKKLFLNSLFGYLIIYLFGLVYFYIIANYITANPITLWPLLLHCFIVFIPGDLVKCVAAGLTAKRVIPLLNKQK